jgi:hypothetical protein
MSPARGDHRSSRRAPRRGPQAKRSSCGTHRSARIGSLWKKSMGYGNYGNGCMTLQRKERNRCVFWAGPLIKAQVMRTKEAKISRLALGWRELMLTRRDAVSCYASDFADLRLSRSRRRGPWAGRTTKAHHPSSPPARSETPRSRLSPMVSCFGPQRSQCHSSRRNRASAIIALDIGISSVYYGN